jgi:cytochrome c553
MLIGDSSLLRRTAIWFCVYFLCGRVLAAELAVPAWLFPINAPDPAGRQSKVHDQTLHLPGSAAAFTRAGVTDLFAAVDWHPAAHDRMPDIVAHGRRPGVYACGYCHLPAGSGRPENAALAGLPAAYIVQQVLDLKSGARRSAWHADSFVPNGLMLTVAKNISAAELDAAARYFAAQSLPRRIEVVERERIPHPEVRAWLYVVAPDARTEPLGERIIEMAPDLERHEMRDDSMRYVAYVPAGSILRGETLAAKAMGTMPACTSCHGKDLRGAGIAPPLAGRSPTYILRQLWAFRNRDRAGDLSAPMQAIADAMSKRDMISAAAYLASRAP